MKTDQELKEMVKEKYGAIADKARSKSSGSSCGCGCGCSTAEIPPVAEDYTNLPGYVPDADLALGCGLPTAHAHIYPGDTVVDLGSGAGNDCFVARSIVGENGRVIGIDMTEAMIAKANANAAKLGFKNVEFRLGDIDNMPLEANTADVVVSNCVMNLVPDKSKAFAETYRILKPGGHFSISDIVLQGEIPPELRDEATLYAGCVAGALTKDDYLRIIRETGFTNIAVQKERKYEIPENILRDFLTDPQIEEYRRSLLGIFSITVYAEKPLSVTMRPATGEDTETIRQLLAGNGLPTDTVGTPLTDFYVAADDGRIAGVAAFEYYGEDALLRSVAIPKSLQKHRIGSIMVDWMIALARQRGMKRLVLLTETASGFFAKKGFVAVERSAITNEAMKKSPEFGGCCCSSATCMLLSLPVK
jgi:ubiquinone/menaquinone biosynthesis C-methylase UbiE/N-acetylglutamate synthase-like GNAT family acetyltransferase